MENWFRRTTELVCGLALTNKKYPSPIPYYPQKTICHSGEEKIFERTSPDKVGVKPSSISNLLTRLEKEPSANVHSIVIVKDGKIISEAASPGYSTNIWHLSHSMSKSVIGMAIGLLVDEGKLEITQRVDDFFPELDAAVLGMSQGETKTVTLTLPDPFYKDLADIVAKNNGLWCLEAEKYLLANAKAL